MLKLVLLGVVLGHLTFVLWLGFWTGTFVYLGVWFILGLAFVSKPSHELPQAS